MALAKQDEGTKKKNTQTVTVGGRSVNVNTPTTKPSTNTTKQNVTVGGREIKVDVPAPNYSKPKTSAPSNPTVGGRTITQKNAPVVSSNVDLTPSIKQNNRTPDVAVPNFQAKQDYTKDDVNKIRDDFQNTLINSPFTNPDVEYTGQNYQQFDQDIKNKQAELKIAEGKVALNKEIQDTNKQRDLTLNDVVEEVNGKTQLIDYGTQIAQKEEENAQLEAELKELESQATRQPLNKIGAVNTSNLGMRMNQIRDRLNANNEELAELNRRSKYQKAVYGQFAYEDAVNKGDTDTLLAISDEHRSYDDNWFERRMTSLGRTSVDAVSTVVNVAQIGMDLGGQVIADVWVKGAEEMKENGTISDDQFNKMMETVKPLMDYDANDESTLGRQLRDISNQLSYDIQNGVDTSTVQGKILNFIGQGLDSTTNFLAQYMLFGEAGSLALMSGQSGSEKYFENLENGYDQYTAFANGLATGMTSYFVEKIGMDNFVSILNGDVGNSIFANAWNAIAGGKSPLSFWANATLSQGLSEGLEEGVEGTIDYLLDNFTAQLTGGEPVEYNPGDIFYSMLVGGFSGALTGASASLNVTINTRKQYNALKADVDSLISARDSALAKGQDVTLANRAIEVGQALLDNYQANTLTMAVELASDMVEPNPNVQGINEILSTILDPNVSQDIKVQGETNELIRNVMETAQTVMQTKGINMDAEEYVNLTPEARENTTKVQDYANKLRANIMFSTKIDGDGYFDPKTGMIVVNPNSDLAQVSTLVHELTHGTESSGVFYDALAKLVRENYGTEEEYKNAIANVKKFYRNTGINLNNDGAKREFTAINTQSMLGNEDFVKRLVRYNESLAYRIFSDVRNMFSSDAKTNIENAFMQAYRGIQQENTGFAQASFGLTPDNILDENKLDEELQNRSIGSLRTVQDIDPLFRNNPGYGDDAENGRKQGGYTSLFNRAFDRYFSGQTRENLQESGNETVGVYPGERLGAYEGTGIGVVAFTNSSLDQVFNRAEIDKRYGVNDAITYMNPRQFIYLTAQGFDDRDAKVLWIDELAKQIRKLDKSDMSEAFSSDKGPEGPAKLFLFKDKNGNIRVDSHEGRHRLWALANEGITNVPVVLRYRNDITSNELNNARLYVQTNINNGVGYYPAEYESRSVTIGRNTVIDSENRKAIEEKYGPSKEAEYYFSKGMTPEQLKISQDYNKAVNDDDMEVAQELVRDYAQEYANKTGQQMFEGYHGTNAVFNEFLEDKLGSKNFLAESARLGYFMAGSKETAEAYTGLNSADLFKLNFDKNMEEKRKQIVEKYGLDKLEEENNKARQKYIDDALDAILSDTNNRYGLAMSRIDEAFPDWSDKDKKTLADNFRDIVRTEKMEDGQSRINHLYEEYESTSDLHKQLTELNSKASDEYEQEALDYLGYTPNVKHLFAFMKNPLVHDFKREGRDVDFSELLRQAHKNGNDGAVFYNVQDGGDFDTIYVVFKPNQFKSADPVAYDDNGNVIPLEKRFNQSTNDLRYSKGMTTEDLEGDYGYHYGAKNLDYNKKSERLSSRSGRGTGAFGTGTYFFGDGRFKSSYMTDKGKTEHKVDFSDYNLFRPKTTEEGYALHDALKSLDDNYGFVNENSLEEYLGEIENIRDEMLALVGEEQEDSNRPRLDIDDLDVNADDFMEQLEKRSREFERAYDEYEANRPVPDYDRLSPEDDEYNYLLNRLINAGMDEDEAYDLFNRNADETGDVDLRKVAKELVTNYLNYEDRRTYDVPYSVRGRINFENNRNVADKLSKVLNVPTSELSGIIKNAMLDSKEESTRPDFREKMYDSVGTKVMKALGYEGIDVRNMEGLDNSTYGSVIYDLKPSSVQYSKGMKPQDLLADTEEYRATIAPYYDTRLNENNRDELIKMAEEAYDNVAKEIAGYLGIKLTPKAENIGGFENDEGKRLRELSWTYDLKGVDSENARLFTSLMGDLAFENQEAVICMRYLSEDEGQHIAGEEGPDGGTYGKEYGFKYKDLKTVEEALKKADIANYNIDRKTNYLTVQDFGFDDDLPEKLDILLEGNNYETKEERPIYSYYLSREARQSLYEARGITEGGLQEGNQSGISGRISEANKRVTDVIEKKKSGTESPFLRRPEVKAYQQDSDGDLNLTDEDLKNYRVIESATTEKYGKKNIDKETGILKPKAIIELDTTIGKTTHEEEIQDGEEYAGKFAQELDNGADVDDLLQKMMSNELQNGIVRAYYVSQVLADRDMQSEYMELAQWARDIGNLGGKLVESNKILYDLDSTFSKAVYLTQVEENLKSEYKERLKNKKGVDVEQTISEIFNEYANKIINSKTSREFRSAIGALTREVNRRMPKTIWDRIHQYRMLAMLSGAKTAVANFVSNTFSLGLYRMNSMNQALLESAMQNVEIKSFDDKKTYRINQEDRNATLRKDSTATKRNRKLATEIWDSLGENEKTKYGIETEKIPDIIKNNLKIKNETTQSKLSKAVGGLFDTVQNVQGVLLNDAPFAKVAFVQKFDELARARGINTDKINKSSKEYARLIDDAYNYAQEVVSHNDTDISKTIANLTRKSASNVRINEDSTLVGLDKQIKRFKERANNGEPIYRFIDNAVSKLQKWFIPFYKTNASLLQKSLQFSPLEWGQVINDWGKVKAGRMEVVDMIEHMSKAVTGTELYLIGAIFGFLGLLKWEKDDEDYSGRLSIKIPGTDKGYTVDFIDPISTIFAKGVVLAQNISEQGGPFKTIEGLVRDYEDIFLSDELDMFSSMKDFFDTVGKVRKGKDDYGEYTLGDGATDIAFSVLNSYIPSIVRDVSRMIDPAKKNVYDTDNKKYLFNRLVNSTPFRTNLVDKKDATGRTINYTQPFTGNDVFDRILTQMVSRGKLVDSNGQAITTRSGSQNMQATSSDGYTQMAKDFQYKDENGDGFSDAHWIRDSVPSNIYPAGVQTELTPKEKETYGKTWTDTWTSGANYLADNDIYKGLSYENQADVVYELQGFARECIEADYCMANDLEMTEAQRTANEIRKFCTVNGKLDGKMLGLIALGTAKENKLASGGQRYVMAEQDEEGNTIRNSRQLAMRHIYEEAGIYDKIVEAVQNSDGALTYADFGLGKTVVEKYSDEKAGSDYQTIYNKTMKSSSKKSSKVSGGSAGGITKAKGGGSTKKLSMAPNPARETKVANSYLKAYADVFKRNSSKATSSSGGTVICPKCGNRVYAGAKRCPVCGTSL